MESKELLKIKTKEGYAFKILLELLQDIITREGGFTFNEKGIKLHGSDEAHSKIATKLIELELYKKKFNLFKLSSESFTLGTNMSHFYKMLKPTKKKDSLTLIINESDPTKLIIDINGAQSYIKICKPTPDIYDPLTGYEDPIVTNSKEFQKLKQLNRISRTIQVTATKKKITFSATQDKIFGKTIIFGNEDDEESEDDAIIYNQTFTATDITGLVKVGGLSQNSNIAIYATPDLPLKFTIDVSILGVINVYIKSQETIAEESEDLEKDEKG